MDPVRFLLSTTVALMAGCSTVPNGPVARSYDLSFVHPAPHASYIQVTPGSPGAALPAPQEITSRDFALYLRANTGCTVDAARRASVIGSHTVPAGYMVPIACP
ncbi:hypothetical protein EI983_03325 [Roseovarius faecimaris]|uniref:Lipoprotein n=1 Tax=Roseovarius faecimaris TaxID=2494550 RepID=A0A6I6IM40_9RHOB|nr:hypothetical protein [Roseovarius faecimaris]QGX97362.1 hypothetical protein EI983_03325 [Roseovarius faecimaris]